MKSNKFADVYYNYTHDSYLPEKRMPDLYFFFIAISLISYIQKLIKIDLKSVVTMSV